VTSFSKKLKPAILSQQTFEVGSPERVLGNGLRFWSKSTSDGLETLCGHHPAIVAIRIFTCKSD
jgi:hypothetical protein